MTELEYCTSSNQVPILSSETEDRISKLPNNLLCHILAFLPTRCSVATSILSKRWRYIWIDIPVLDFTDLPYHMTDSVIVFNKVEYASFMNFVNRVLLFNGVPCLERVHIETYEGFSARHVFEWMLILTRRCVRELSFLAKDFLIGLPPFSLLAQEKLVVLRLEGFKFKMPLSMHLPCLHTLSLTKVEFSDECNPLTSLLSSCPFLEELNIDRCEKIEKFSVCSPSVKILRIVAAGNKKVLLIETPNLEVLHLSMGIIRSKVADLSSLVKVRLDVWTSSVRWIKLLQRIRYTRTLVLYQIILDGSALTKLPTFQNLTHLEVGFTAWSIVLPILIHAPNLVSFIIHKLMFDWPDTTPRSKELALEQIEYHGFDVREGFEAVGYFLSNSPLLKKLEIYTRRWPDPTTENEILKKLLKFPRASKLCEVSVLSEYPNCESDDSDDESEGLESDDTTSLEDDSDP